MDSDHGKNLRNMRKNGIIAKNINYQSRLDSFNAASNGASDSNYVLEIKRPLPNAQTTTESADSLDFKFNTNPEIDKGYQTKFEYN
mgnify:CR=1 FL=1|jgi:hypothetical protein